jgi:hypothetical protein
MVPDPVGEHFVESLAHPGGDATGLSLLSTDLTTGSVSRFDRLTFYSCCGEARSLEQLALSRSHIDALLPGLSAAL